MRHITIKDLAKLLDVSIATVSRALNNDKNIKLETKEKILRAAEQHGYRRNPVAINLKSGRSNTIGVIVPEINTPFFSKIIEGMQSVLYANGLKVIVAYSNEDTNREKENLLLMEQFMVDGIIVGICHKDKNKDVFNNLIAKGIPLVFYDRIPSDIEASKVIIDDYRKSFFLVEYLIRKGLKSIAHIKAPNYMQSSDVRYQGYRDALHKFRIPFRKELVILSQGMSFDDGILAVKQLIDSKQQIEAIFAFTDTVAIGAMNYIMDNGIKVPEDIAVAGFSGTILSEVIRPSLTTVEQPLFEMGESSARLLLEKINNRLTECQTIVLDAEIKIRNSTEKMG